MNRWQPAALGAALLLGAALTVVPLPLGGLSPAVALFCGGPALVFLALGTSRIWPAAVWLALVLLASEQLLAAVLSEGIVIDAPLRGAALLWFGELAWLAGQPAGSALPRAQLVAAGVVGLIGAALGWLVLGLVGVPLPGGPLLTAIGVAAVVAALTAFLWLSRSGAPPTADA